MSESLKNRMWRGSLWVGLGQFGAQIMQLIIALILIRVLEPSDFGLIAMIVIFTGIAEILIVAGYGAAIVQRKVSSDQLLSSIFWLNLALGTSLFILFIFLAPLISSFFNEPILTNLVRVSSFVFICAGLNVVQDALFVRSMDFKPLAIRRLLAIGISGIIGIVMAMNGYGVWALIAQQVTNYSIKSLLVWFASHWRPSFIFSWSSLKEIFPFTNSLLASALLNFSSKNFDNLLIGRFWGQVDLGLYSKPYGLMLMPIKNFSSIITRVLFPGLSSIKDDIERVNSMYLLMLRLLVFISWPLMLLVLVAAEPFVLVVFGPKWMSIVPLVRFFAISGMLMSYVSLLRSLMLSQGRKDVIYRDGVINNVLIILAIAICIKWGIWAVALGKMIADIGIFWFSTYHSKLCTGISIKSQLLNIKDLTIYIIFIGLISFVMVEGLQAYISPFILLGSVSGFIGLALILLGESQKIDVYQRLKYQILGGS